MEIYLEKLGLSSLPDLKSIKKAYAAKLKTIDQSNIQEFQEVREAYLYLCGKGSPEPSDAGDINIDCDYDFDYFEEENPSLPIFRALVEELSLENDNKDFSAVEWINSQLELDSLQARTDFSVILLQEFITGADNWSYKVMRDTSYALNWHEINDGLAHYTRLLVVFENLLEQIDFNTRVLIPMNSFFSFKWGDPQSAFNALSTMRKEINCDYYLLSDLFLRKTIESCSSAPIAALAANRFFGWKNLDYVQQQPLEIALLEARFRVTLLLVKADQSPPTDTEGYPVWRLKQPFDYWSEIDYLASNSIEPIISVIHKMDVYNIKGELNEDQVKFYKEHYRGGPEHHSQRAVRHTKFLRTALMVAALIVGVGLLKYLQTI